MSEWCTSFLNDMHHFLKLQFACYVMHNICVNRAILLHQCSLHPTLFNWFKSMMAKKTHWIRKNHDPAGIRHWQSRSAQNVCLHPCQALALRSPPSLPGRPLKYGGESSSFSITQSLFLPRWRATESSALTAGIPYGPYPWPCSQM